MSGFGNMMKEGWHPKGKDGAKESWRGDFKGIDQVAGWMGKGKDSSSDRADQGSKPSFSLKDPAGWLGKGKDSSSDRADHASKPLSSLKDPGSFGPPPRHANYRAAAVPGQTTADRQGLGASLSQEQTYSQDAHYEQEEEEPQKPAPPPVPYRANTTGLSTSNLPPPPVRRLDSPASAPSSATSTKPKPQLPPRLPARGGPASHPPSPPPAYSPTTQSPSQGYVNQGAASRLSNAGVSVPALGIRERDGRQAQTSAGTRDAAPVNELQSRFSQLRTNTASSPSAPSPSARTSQQPTMNEEAGAGGSSSLQNFRERHADKIDAGRQKLGGLSDSAQSRFSQLRTNNASSPSAPSPSARSPQQPTTNEEAGAGGSSSLQDFRERHADKIDAGKQKLGGLTSRVNTFVEDRRFSANANQRIPRPPAYAPSAPSAPSEQSAVPENQAARKKTLPPPPPPKRADIRATPVGAGDSSPSSPAPTPPPAVPMSTKPR